MMNPPTMATKWTSAILSRLFALNISPATRPYPSPTVHTPAYSRSYASASKHLSPEELEQKKKEARLRQLEKLRLRYQTDPEYREKMKQHAKAQRAAISADPELLAKYREMERQRYEDPVVRDKKRQYQRAKYATDSEFRNRRLDKMRQYSKLKFAHDPQVREKSIQAGKNYWQKLKSTLKHDPEAYKLISFREVRRTRGAKPFTFRTLNIDGARLSETVPEHQIGFATLSYGDTMNWCCTQPKWITTVPLVVTRSTADSRLGMFGNLDIPYEQLS
jgi:hypothetical protein